MPLGQPCRSMSALSFERWALRTLLVSVLAAAACDGEQAQELPAIDAQGNEIHPGDTSSDPSSSDSQGLPGGQPGADDALQLRLGCRLPAQPACDAAKVVIASQQALEAFSTWGCTTFAGDLLLTQAQCTEVAPIHSLSPLLGLRQVSGELALVALSHVPNLQGLDNLDKLGSLRLVDLQVQALAGLADLAIDQALTMQDLPQLGDAQAMATWRLAGTSVTIENLALVSSLPPFAQRPGLKRVIMRDLPVAQVNPWLASLAHISQRLELARVPMAQLDALHSVDLRTVSEVHLVELPLAASSGVQLQVSAQVREVTLQALPKVEDLGFLGDVAIASAEGDATLVLRDLPRLVSLSSLRFGAGVHNVAVEQSALAKLTPMPSVVTGALSIKSNPNLIEVEGPIELRQARLQVIDQPLLTHLASFSPASQPLAVHLERLPSLADLSSFATIVKWAPQRFIIDRLPGLRTLEGLGKMQNIGSLHSGCDVLCNAQSEGVPSESRECAMQAKVWQGELRLTDNAGLQSLQGLENLRSVGGTMAIYGSPSLPPTETCEIMRIWRKEAADGGLLCGPWIDRDEWRLWCEEIQEN